MSTTPAPLLSRLEGVKPAGEGRWYARCPAHADRSPSLSIRDTGEKVLIHCHAGCDPEDVLRAVGLTWGELHPGSPPLTPVSEGARRYVKRTLTQIDAIDLERMVLRIAAADLRQGKTLSVEDTARVELARERIQAWGAAR